MILGTGLDIVCVARMARLMERFPERTATLLLTEAERRAMPTAMRRRIVYIASRFAAKEATVKALGTGFRDGITVQDIAVQSGLLGKPEITLWGEAAIRAQKLGVERIHLSITHEREYVAAMVILE